MIYPKISKSIKITVKLRQFCLTETLLVVYNSRTLPFLQYCSIIWVSNSCIHIPPFLGLQTKVIQIIVKYLLCAHSYPLFKTLHILDIFKIYKHQLSCFVFLHTAKLQPSLSPFVSIFISDFHKYSTRQKNNLYIYSHRITFLSLRNSSTSTLNYRQKLRDNLRSL